MDSDKIDKIVNDYLAQNTEVAYLFAGLFCIGYGARLYWPVRQALRSGIIAHRHGSKTQHMMRDADPLNFALVLAVQLKRAVMAVIVGALFSFGAIINLARF
ncbi:hypothetical protein [Deinococcus peraridilitoris]|uniref:Uncharacterized protein n=1 Tax=Deinococcus peraridilitoris (strain DSM 19664 / LMG 22246 / CIP 109416 / KR-200) TaxID=937777 RepID=L0A263_DEIPD|nr:hypothetical protein [Deinococcus peraridilitoris]AFZ67988.1 hypothetical protein Deipe_2523 [Deinococcus peraridilitoris DSM 19664]